MSEEIAYCKIFPPIGIARVGNSLERDGFFIGPEGITLPGLAHERRFTDAAGAVLRQAARFRIYAFDANDVAIGELTAQEAELTWSVSLANKKPEWFEFNGGAEALAQFETPEQELMGSAQCLDQRCRTEAQTDHRSGRTDHYRGQKHMQFPGGRIRLCREIPGREGRLSRRAAHRRRRTIAGARRSRTFRGRR